MRKEKSTHPRDTFSSGLTSLILLVSHPSALNSGRIYPSRVCISFMLLRCEAGMFLKLVINLSISVYASSFVVIVHRCSMSLRESDASHDRSNLLFARSRRLLR